MTDEDTIPTGKLARLRYSISNLKTEFANTDNLVVGTLINLTLALLGIAVFLMFDPWLSYVGTVWAIMHVAAIVGGWIQA